MKPVIVPLLAVAMAVAVTGCEKQATGDGQVQAGTKFCIDTSDGRETCRISLVSLAFEPASLEGRLLSSRGVLVVDGGHLAIYSSREAFRIGDRRQALRVRAPASVQRKLAEDFQGMVIIFRGRVDTSDETTIHRLGFMAEIRDIERVSPAILPDAENLQPIESLAFDRDDLD